MGIQGTREQLVKQKMFMTKVMNSILEFEGQSFVRISTYTLASREYIRSSKWIISYLIKSF